MVCVAVVLASVAEGQQRSAAPTFAMRDPAGVSGAAGADEPGLGESGAKGYLIVRDIRGRMRRRVVKSFDFDERKLGNVEDVPMYWRRHRGEGFPHFLSGQFDLKTGHDAPPSFRLQLKGGSLGYVYRAQDIPVHVHSDYVVSVWIRPDRLKHARACVSVFYCDRSGRKLPGSERFSQLIGGSDGSQDWQQVALKVPGGDALARHVGLSLWVIQPARPSASDVDEHYIYRQDLDAGAWFDDIKVVRLPRASLTTARAGNVFEVDEDAILHAQVGDPEGEDLSAHLEVLSADGEKLMDETIPVSSGADAKPEVVNLGRLLPGLYRGRLSVRSGELELSECRVRFAQLGPRLNSLGGRNEGFGVVLAEADYASTEATARLIDLLHVPHVKLPVGGPMGGKRRPRGAATGASLKLFERLWRNRVAAVATLTGGAPGGPGHVHPATGSGPSLLTDLGEKPDAWRPWLTRSVVRYAGFARAWQVGADEEGGLAWDDRLAKSLQASRAELSRLAPAALMAIPWPIRHQLRKDAVQADYVSLYVPNTVRPEGFASCIRAFRKARPKDLWAVVQPLEAGRYERIGRLADLTKRLAEAHASGVDVVYLPRPWDAVRRPAGPRIEPCEEYIVFRTVVELLSRSRPVGELYLGPGVHVRTFDRDGVGMLVAWDDRAGPEGRTHVAYLGAAPEQVDMWGRARPLERFGKGHKIHLLPTPTFVRGAEVWPLKMRASFALDPPAIESSHRLHEHVIRFVNPQGTPISGVLRLKPPPDWEVRPLRIRFSLAPGQEFRTRVTLRFPSNEVAGPKLMTGIFTVDADQTYELTALAPFELGLKDLEVRSFARIDRNNVIVQQTITNRSGERVDVEGYVLAPGRARQSGVFRRLEPGQTMVRKYVLDNARRLQGRGIRVGLREIRGPRMLNEVLVIQ